MSPSEGSGVTKTGVSCSPLFFNRFRLLVMVKPLRPRKGERGSCFGRRLVKQGISEYVKQEGAQVI